MGTPDFAVPSLQILIDHQYDVVAVITAPDKPKGRGQQLAQSPIKVCALRHNIPVLQPKNLKDPDFLNELESYKANLQVVVAFRMLPEAVWSMPALGTFNLHASLLPQYRGAAPINWAIINGETETGVTTFFLQHEIDTGGIIFQEKEIITAHDTAGSLYERLMSKGARLVLKTVQAIEKNEFPTKEQPEVSSIKHAPKIFKETCEINWNQSAASIINLVRGLSPYPAAWTVINGRTFKIYQVQFVSEKVNAEPPYTTDQKNYLYFKSNDGWVSIEELQPEGKKRMLIKDFFRGNKL